MNRDEIEAANQRVIEAGAFVQPLLSEVGKVIVGQSYLMERLVISLLANGHVLLEGVPGGLKLVEVRTAIAGVPGVAGLHDLHVWSMSNDDVSCTVHVVLKEGADVDATRTAVQAVLLEKYEIEHSTIQTEGSDRQCGDEDHLHR